MDNTTDKTLATWKQLPWLISKKQVIAFTGLTECELIKLVRSELLHRHRGTRGHYFKTELTKFCKIE
jgi:hypothetical protein